LVLIHPFFAVHADIIESIVPYRAGGTTATSDLVPCFAIEAAGVQCVQIDSGGWILASTAR